MRYPRLLEKGDVVGVCAPSSGVPERLFARLERAAANVRALGYGVAESPEVRGGVKCVSGDASARAAALMALYERGDVAAIIPPWGGEFLMDMLPLLDFERLAALPPTWVCGYSDISTLTFVLTLLCDVATVHGSNFMNMGGGAIHASDLAAFAVMAQAETTQESAPYWGDFAPGFGAAGGEMYQLAQKSAWQSLSGEDAVSFAGRMLGGCMDTLCKLIGTRFAPVEAFVERYRREGLIWTLESCEMNAAEIYRTLWQMRECGWFRHCSGVIYGRAAGYADTQDFTLIDALAQGLEPLGVPVLYGADIGHVPPQMQIVNGAVGRVDFAGGRAAVRQVLTP